MRRLVVLLLMLFSIESLAAQCSAVFTDGASSSSVSGEIEFKRGSVIFNSSGTLDFASIKDETNNSSCYTQACQLSGNLASPLIVPAFRTTNSNSKIEVKKNQSGSTGAGEYEEIKVEQGGSFTFTTTNGVYIIEKFQVGKNAVISMPAGDYWIEEILVEQGAGITLTGQDTVRIYTEKLELKKNVQMNTGGGADRLVVVSEDKILMEQGSSIDGYLYVEGKFEAKKNVVVKGAVHSEELLLENASITFDESALSDTDFNGMCGTQAVDHYRIVHDTAALTCEAETISIKACANAACDEAYEQTSSVVLEPFSQTINIPADSLGHDVQVAQTTAGNAALSLSSQVPAANGGLKCFDTFAPGATEIACEILFADAGFEIYGATPGSDVPDQLASDNFSSINVRAVQNNNGVCEALLQGTQTVDMSYSCQNPAGCKTPLSFGATNLDPSAQVDLVFDAAGIAPLDGLIYRDAGRINLNIAAEIDGANITSGLADVLVYPDKLDLVTSDATAIYDAGADFALNIRALGTDGTILKNYQPGDLQLKFTRSAPLGSSYSEGQLQYSAAANITSAVSAAFESVSITAFFDGVHSTSANVSEAGSYLLDVQDANYLGRTIPIENDTDLVLGRFIPAYFSVTENTPDLLDTYTSAGSFSYFGRPFGFNVNPEFVVTALNANGQPTRNYQSDSDWAWLPDQSELNNVTFTDSNHATGITLFDRGSAAATDVTVGGIVQHGSKLVTLSGIQIIYNKAVNPEAPKAAVTSMTVPADFFVDNSYAGNPICFINTYDKNNPGACESKTVADISGASLRWGRLVLENAFGPETEDKLVPLRTEYFESVANGFLLNRDDNINTRFDWVSDDFDLTDPDDGIPDITDDVAILNSSITVTGGKTLGFEGIRIRRPADDARGRFIIELLPVNDASITWDDYLQFDWNGTDPGIGNPSAEVSFGQYRGNDRIIHWREVFN